MKLNFPKALLLISALANQACGNSVSEPSTQQASPSFDCKKASNYIEQAICKSPAISNLDAHLAKIYKDKKDLDKKLASNQREWLKTRNTCSNNAHLENCLEKAYIDRIDELSKIQSETSSNLNSDLNKTIKYLLNSEFYKRACSATPNSNNSPSIEKYRISDDKLLLLLVCEEGAYQNSYIGYKIENDTNPSDLRPIKWRKPNFDETWKIEESEELLGNFNYNNSKKLLEVTNRSNGAGTCGSVAIYDLSKLENANELSFSSASGESDCFAGITIDDWNTLTIQ